jgi:hypothetical protein
MTGHRSHITLSKPEQEEIIYHALLYNEELIRTYTVQKLQRK